MYRVEEVFQALSKSLALPKRRGALTHAKVVLVDLIYFTEANLKVMKDPKMLVQK